jgi:hypothetical protein
MACSFERLKAERIVVNNKRNAPRQRVLKGAFIILSDKAPKLQCTIRNLSATGAALQVSTTYGLPPIFDLIIDGVRRRCHSQWRTDTKIGVLFEG